MAVFQVMTIESKLPNQIRWSRHISFFSKEAALFDEAKTWRHFYNFSTKNPPVRFGTLGIARVRKVVQFMGFNSMLDVSLVTILFLRKVTRTFCTCFDKFKKKTVLPEYIPKWGVTWSDEKLWTLRNDIRRIEYKELKYHIYSNPYPLPHTGSQ